MVRSKATCRQVAQTRGFSSLDKKKKLDDKCLNLKHLTDIAKKCILAVLFKNQKYSSNNFIRSSTCLQLIN